MSGLPEKPLIYLITPGDASSENLTQTAERLASTIRLADEAGVVLLQIREKALSAHELFELAAHAASAARGTSLKILINSRADIAATAGADGVHLPADAIPAAAIRKSFPPNFLIGVSAHDLDDARAARSGGADFVTFSPIFESPGKGTAKGIRELARVCADLEPFPVIALGGVNESNYKDALAVGAAGFAAIRFLNDDRTLRRLAAGEMKS